MLIDRLCHRGGQLLDSCSWLDWCCHSNFSSCILTGNWSEGFDEKLEALRTAVMTINSTRVDPSLIDGIKGLSSWMSSAFSHFKEWVGVGLFGATLCCGLVFLLWLVCKLNLITCNEETSAMCTDWSMIVEFLSSQCNVSTILWDARTENRGGDVKGCNLRAATRWC